MLQRKAQWVVMVVRAPVLVPARGLAIMGATLAASTLAQQLATIHVVVVAMASRYSFVQPIGADVYMDVCSIMKNLGLWELL